MGYAPPVGYRNNYNNVRVNNVNINVNNNNNYYNRFDNNQNLRNGGTRSPISNSPNRAAQQPRTGNTATAGNSANWKGQSTYAGSRSGNTAATARPSAGTQPANRATTGPANTAQRADRGYAAAQPAATNRPATTNATTNRPATTNAASRPTPQATPQATSRESAFSSAKTQGGGNFQRSASARGNASAGSRQVSGGARKR